MRPNRLPGRPVPVEFDELASELRKISNVLNDYLRETDIEVAGSLAAVEYRQESSFADDLISDPILHIGLQAQRSLVAATDHILGLAACIEAERVTLASFTLMRPIMVAAGINYYLLDPDIALRERLRRGWNFELESVREELNSLDKDVERDAWLQVASHRYRYLRWGSVHGYGREQKNDRYGERRYWLSDDQVRTPPPSEIRLASDVLAAVGDGTIGRRAYKFTSAFVHTQPHAFSVLLQAHMQADIKTPGVVPLGVSPGDMTTWLAVLMMAVHETVKRCGHYFGWDLDVWNREALPKVSRWVAVLRQT